MARPDFILYIVKLSLGALASFCAILLWSKTHDGAVMTLVSGVVIAYAGIIYSMLVDMGIVAQNLLLIAGIPFLTLFFAALPPLLIAVAFLMMIFRSKR